MKKFYLLFIFVAALQYAVAQPTMTTLPQVGNIVHSEYAHVAGTQIGAIGANITWNYSGLVDRAATGVIKFVNAAGTAYAADFSGATYAAVIADTIFSYYQIVSGSPAIMGLESSITKTTYIRPTVVLQYPFTYSDAFHDSVTINLERPITGTSKLLDTILVTGYGTLKLPGKTYNDVLQVQHINASSGTITIPNVGSFPSSPTLDTTYTYYKDGIVAPLLFYSVFKGKINVIDYLKSTSTLPLHFISFIVSPNKVGLLLNWQTGDESNTSSFNIQRSIDGTMFSNIAMVSAAGNGAHHYHYTDTNIPKAATLYYRVQETDKDGTVLYSKVIAYKSAQATQIKRYPNPASTQITITGIADFTALKIFNIGGQLMLQQPIHNQSVTIALKNLPSGVYLIELSNSNRIEQLKFLKK